MSKLTHHLAVLSLLGLFGSCATGATATSTSELVTMSEVDWQPLNPARGDMSPKAGTLWGDRTTAGPSGFLVEFRDGFESPPHVHNVSYRGVVLSGLVHNDDPRADEMWLPAGSFWTQPRGAEHITAARGSRNLAYIEIEEGPYLVLPVEEQFESGEVPINVDESNLVWLEPRGARTRSGGPEVAFLWGSPRDDQWNGTFVELPAGFTGEVRSHGGSLRAVVIQGRPRYRAPGASEARTLDPGSYFGSTGEARHQLSCGTTERCVVYVRAQGRFDVVPAKLER